MEVASGKITADVGVIVGRFQVHKLHDAHRDLIETVLSRHEKVILFLGLSHLKATKKNPLDYESRKRMIEAEYPRLTIAYIPDCKSDKVWTRNLDQQIAHLTGAGQSVILYGSRDSFIEHYTGKYKTVELVPQTIVSGTELRKTISRSVMNTEDFRAGAIWATQQQYDSCVPTVDIAIYRPTDGMFLMARKPDETQYRFVGGFADPRSESYEADAVREVREETGVEVADLKYIGSFIVNDWRFRAESSKIKTILFLSTYVFGRPEAADDICEVRWMTLDEMSIEGAIVDGHVKLVQRLREVMGK